ncbi:hypothetical protein [uncultured Clostridium sp.]|uniref:hypothetical protein n=1 Tax=uncultured Clostridium sp. TaxID=59620 RepID=UPI003216308A
MKKINFKKIVISLCLLLTVLGCNLGFSSKAFAQSRIIMSFNANGVRDSYISNNLPTSSDDVFQLWSDGKADVIISMDRWSTSDRSGQNMVFEIWKRVGVGQYKLYRTSQPIGGTGEYKETFNLGTGIYKLKIRTLDPRVYVYAHGKVLSR